MTRKNLTKTLKRAGLILISIPLLYGFGDYLCGGTTGHLSADLYLGKKQPTFLEKFIIDKTSNYFDLKSKLVKEESK